MYLTVEMSYNAYAVLTTALLNTENYPTLNIVSYYCLLASATDANDNIDG